MRTPKFVRSEVTSAKLAPLVEKAIERHVPAWHALVVRLFPGIEEVAGRFRNAGRLAGSVDERRNVAVQVIERLQARELDGLKRLREVCAAGQDSAWPWICRIAQRKAYDRARDHDENLGPDAPGGAPRFARLVELPDEVEDLPPRLGPGSGRHRRARHPGLRRERPLAGADGRAAPPPRRRQRR